MKSILSSGRHLSYKAADTYNSFFYETKIGRYFSMMELNTAADLYFHMVFLTKNFCVH